ncbi:MAG TPA: hypothetical protein VM940_15510 [Chthoniobacterales bacterium]|nr:hypothetical protein [Chthoniobacterales bacterium]
MSDCAYRVAPIFLIRLAGVPFDVIESLATPRCVALAKDLILKRKSLKEAIEEVEVFFRSRQQLLAKEAYHALRVAVRAEQPLAGVIGDQPAFFLNYASIAAEVASLKKQLEDALILETERARTSLIESSRNYLPRYLVFAAENVRGLLWDELNVTEGDGQNPRSRNNAKRKLEQSLLMYLQRVATKNDTFSEFGPSGWGGVTNEKAGPGLSLAPVSGVASREVFLERWVAHGVAAAINADPEIPVQEPVEVPALDPHAFRVLLDDVSKWPDGPARSRWLPRVERIADLAADFGKTTDPEARRALMASVRDELTAIGWVRGESDRFLYSASNPIGEECFRTCNFSISEELIQEVADEAAPWINFWRDSYAFIASRVAGGLRQILETFSPEKRAVPLPQFLKICESARLPLTGPGLVALAHIAFQEVKKAFRDQLGPQAGKAEYQLTAEDCDFVRRNLEYPKFDEYTYPSADLQLAAQSIEAVARGDYRWVLAELHPPIALLHHAGYWSCPDKPALNAALAATTHGRPGFHFGFFAADFTAHTTVRIFDALPEQTTFVAPQRADPSWRRVPPAETEVYLDAESGDVALRRVGTGEPLGSFSRSWVIPLGFHPFQFSLGPHTPRLLCGKVVVQRRTWTVTLQEFHGGKFTGLSPDLLVGAELLRLEKDLPRHVYVRPSEQALRRSGAEGRDKDTKPIYIDLESYLFVEIFYRWLTKAGELEVTEMLPDPDHLLWQEKDGRRTFELRTQITPAA